MRNTLRFIALASVLAFVLACGAWRAHAGATGPSLTSGFPPVPSPTASRKLDEYGRLRWRDEKVRLDNYLIDLRNDPTGLACLHWLCGGAGAARAPTTAGPAGATRGCGSTTPSSTCETPRRRAPASSATAGARRAPSGRSAG